MKPSKVKDKVKRIKRMSRLETDKYGKSGFHKDKRTKKFKQNTRDLLEEYQDEFIDETSIDQEMYLHYLLESEEEEKQHEL